MANNNNPSSISAPPKRRRGGRLIPKIILLLGILAIAGLFVWAEIERRQVSDQLQTTEKELEEVRKSTQESGQEAAQRVLERVRALIDIPTEPQPTVATIVDIERLREANEFYNQAENGDHLIITEKRAILYDPDRNIVIDVVPVRVNPNASPSPADAGASPADAGPSPDASPAVSPEASPLASPEASPIATP